MSASCQIMTKMSVNTSTFERAFSEIDTVKHTFVRTSLMILINVNRKTVEDTCNIM